MNLPIETIINGVKHYLYKKDFTTDHDSVFSIYFYAVDEIHAQCVFEDIKTSTSNPEKVHFIQTGD